LNILVLIGLSGGINNTTFNTFLFSTIILIKLVQMEGIEPSLLQ
jgi:hypothetical protein